MAVCEYCKEQAKRKAEEGVCDQCGVRIVPRGEDGFALMRSYWSPDMTECQVYEDYVKTIKHCYLALGTEIQNLYGLADTPEHMVVTVMDAVEKVPPACHRILHHLSCLQHDLNLDLVES